jgi:hypothetical protein
MNVSNIHPFGPLDVPCSRCPLSKKANRIHPRIETDPRVLPWWFGFITPGGPQFLRGYGVGWFIWTMLAYSIPVLGFVVHILSVIDAWEKRDLLNPEIDWE